MRGLPTKIVLALLLACAPGCLEAWAERTGPSLPPLPPDAPIAVYFNQGPERPYIEVGSIHVRSTEDLPQVVEAAKAQARALGAEAILLDLRYHYQSVPVYFDASGAPYVPSTPRLNARAIAVVFTAPPPGPPPPPPGQPPPR